LDDLLAPKEALKSDADLRGPKELASSNSAAGLSSTDPTAFLKSGRSESKESNADVEDSASTSEVASAVAAAGANEPSIAQRPEPEMDFPARVVHLKIENDNLRSALDKLESEP
jgi:hypothetical protein